MAFVRQVVSCPVCGASRRLGDFNLDAQGNFLTNPEDRKVYQLVVKLNDIGGRAHCTWSVHDLPLHVLAGVAAQMRQALAQVENRLASNHGA
jgi:hypothetical protein